MVYPPLIMFLRQQAGIRPPDACHRQGLQFRQHGANLQQVIVRNFRIHMGKVQIAITVLPAAGRPDNAGDFQCGLLFVSHFCPSS